MHFSDYMATKLRKKLNLPGGIGYYRMFKPADQINGHEVHLVGRELTNYGTYQGEVWKNIFSEFDVFWTTYFKDPKNAGAMFYTAQKMKKKVIIDIDDNFWEVPESNPLYENYKKGAKDRAYLSTILFFADVVTTSTEPMKERIMKHFRDVDGIEKKVVVIPNCNEAKDWDFPPSVKSKEEFIIGYSGSNSHQDDLQMVLPSVVNIMKKYPQVKFHIIGAIGRGDVDKYFKDIPEEIRQRIALIGATETFKEYPAWLASQKFNVAIAPLVDSAFTRCKSHIKFMEYTMAGFPVIASRIYPYFMPLNGKEIITTGVTGILCKNNEWESALEEMILHPEKGEELLANARKHILENWQYSQSNIGKTIDDMLSHI